jgi:hypothetical protein
MRDAERQAELARRTATAAPDFAPPAARSILCASGTDGKPVCKAWDAAHDPRQPDPTVQPITTPLRWTSRLMVDADRPKWVAIDRNERRMLSHREISSRSERLSVCLERRRSGGRIRPVGEITESTEEDFRSNRRPIALIGSPARQRSQISEPIQEELESDESVVIPCLGAIRDRSTRCGSLNTV